jgi:cytochrome c peroxidase
VKRTVNLRNDFRRLRARHGWLVLIVACLGFGGAVLVNGCGSGDAPASPPSEAVTPASDTIGERMFLDTRFSEYFATHMTGINQPLAVGDPVVEQVQTPNGTLPGPFAGQSINCRSCHFVTEFQGVTGGGNRTYADFTTRSPIPREMDGFTTTPRNASQMVDSFTARSGPIFLHHDGEFVSAADLVESTMAGRNFGWSPAQYNQAVAHIAQVIREDNGSDQLAADRTNGLSYGVLMLGTDPRITKDLLLPPSLRLNVKTATDQQIFNEIAMMIGQYMKDLLFQRDEFGRYVGSPYDNFLRVNHLPQQPLAGETKAQYNQRLYAQVLALNNPIYITPADGSFKYHAQPYQFGAQELAGLKIFLKAAAVGSDDNQHAGNCAGCHQAPDFSDFVFHNTGVLQEEYDTVHGAGAFMALAIPTLAQRNANFDAYMPASPNHPDAAEVFRRAASATNPLYSDLGLWNIYLNPDVPNPQADLKGFVCAVGKDCSIDRGLASTIAQIKTPVLRDLEDSAPYFHNGSAQTFNDVVEFYIKSSQLAHQGLLRNAPPEFANMSLSESDVANLVAFLKSLTEDYDDA